MGLFANPPFLPMLIGAEAEPFDDDNFIFELKLDGVRCVAFLDKGQAKLYNRRGIEITHKFPELSSIHKQTKKRCILDGELISLIDEKPNFHAILSRSLAKGKVGINAGMTKHPALFLVFDIVYVDGHDITQQPLLSRKEQLKKSI